MNDFLNRIQLAKASITNMELKAAGLIAENQIKIFTETMQRQNERVVWTNMLMPTEIFYAAGLIPIHTELISGWFSTLNLAPKYIQTAHTMGFNINICSYHKTIIGALESGILPPPEIAVFSSYICDGGSMMARYLKKRFNTRTFLLDVPYYKNAENINGLMGKVIKLKCFLEEYIKEKINNNAIGEAVQLSNSARQHLINSNNLRKKGVLFNGYLSLRNMFGAFFLLGSKLGETVAETYYRDLSAKQVIKTKRKILWIHFAPLYAGELMKYFEEELGCSIAFDITGYVYWDKLGENTPYKSISRRMLSHFYMGDSLERIKFYIKIIREYKMDGVVMFMHQGCRAIPGASWELKEISKQINIPFLELYGDCIDNSCYSSQQMKLRMEAFAEGLAKADRSKTGFI